MSFLQNLMSSLQKQEPPAKQEPTVQQPQNAHAASQQQIIQANAQAAAQGGPAPEKPVDIWSAKPEDPALKPEVFGATDNKAFASSLAQMDFMKGINPELVQKAQSGDSSAMLQLLNSVAQNSYGVNAVSTKEMIQQAISSKVGEIEKFFEQKYGERTNTSAIQGANPAFRDADVAPILAQVSKQLQAAYPTASPQELAQHAQKFMTGIAQKILDGTPEAQEKQRAAKTAKSEPNMLNNWLMDGLPE